ncbi:MAG: copper chaperone PCu(A)C [Pseudomonadota bacterium]
MPARSIAVAALVALALAAVAAFTLRAPAPGVLIEGAAASVIVTDGTPTLAITATIRNEGAADRLLSVASPLGKFAMLAGEEDMAGLPIPAGGAPSLAMDGAHVMLMGIGDAPDPGRLIPFTLTFERAGEVAAKARVGEGEAMAGMDHAAMGHGGADHGAMDHGADHAAGLDLPAAEAPGVALEATKIDGGWRIAAETERFRFAPEAMDGPHTPGEGHGHLYIGGLKIMRMTAPTVEIGDLPPGRHRVRLSLNTNDHRPYRADGAPVEATVEIDAP